MIFIPEHTFYDVSHRSGMVYVGYIVHLFSRISLRRKPRRTLQQMTLVFALVAAASFVHAES